MSLPSRVALMAPLLRMSSRSSPEGLTPPTGIIIAAMVGLVDAPVGTAGFLPARRGGGLVVGFLRIAPLFAAATSLGFDFCDDDPGLRKSNLSGDEKIRLVQRSRYVGLVSPRRPIAFLRVRRVPSSVSRCNSSADQRVATYKKHMVIRSR